MTNIVREPSRLINGNRDDGGGAKWNDMGSRQVFEVSPWRMFSFSGKVRNARIEKPRGGSNFFCILIPQIICLDTKCR